MILGSPFLGRLEGATQDKPTARIILAVSAANPTMVDVKSTDVINDFVNLAREAAQSYVALASPRAFKTENDRHALLQEFQDRLILPSEKKVSDLLFLLRLLKEVKKTQFGATQVRTFVATRDFGDDPWFPRHVLAVLGYADIISVNDTEMDGLHTALIGSFQEMPRAYKLRELPYEAIKVCHGAHGVIMDLGCRPETIITSKKFSEKPAAFLEEVLRLGADGATYAMDATAGLGRTANESMIRIYSYNVPDESRQRARFNASFLSITDPMPAGMLAVSSATVVRTLGAIVGLGAIFDGLLLSFLMRE